jgi:hypothetical protein
MKNVITACVSAAMLVSTTSVAFAAVDEQAMSDARERNICENYAQQNNLTLSVLVSAEYKLNNGVNTLYVQCSDDNAGAGALAGLGTGGAVALGAGVLLLAAVLGDDDETVTTTTTASGS